MLALLRMSGRNSILVSACWAFVAMPALCMGGILGHPCETPSQCCGHEGPDDGGAGCDGPDSCSHESDCWNDPCRLFVAARNGGPGWGQPGSDGDREVFEVQLRIDGAVPLASADLPLISHVRSHWPSHRGCAAPRALPCHESDLPLLI